MLMIDPPPSASRWGRASCERKTGPFEVDGDEVVELGFGHLHGVMRLEDAGVVDEHVEPAEAGDGLVDEALAVVGPADIGGDAGGHAAEASISATAASQVSTERPATTTAAPAPANPTLRARPMPRPPPVITATRSRRSNRSGPCCSAVMPGPWACRR